MLETIYTRQTHNSVTDEPEQTTPVRDCPHGSAIFVLQPLSWGGEPNEVNMFWRAETVHRTSKNGHCSIGKFYGQSCTKKNGIDRANW